MHGIRAVHQRFTRMFMSPLISRLVMAFLVHTIPNPESAVEVQNAYEYTCQASALTWQGMLLDGC